MLKFSIHIRPTAGLAGKRGAAAALLALSATLLGACAGGGDGDGRGLSCASAAPPAGGGVGSATAHGTPIRDDGTVVVIPDAQGFRASRVVTLTNDFGGATQADVEFSTQNGGVVSCASGQGGYGIRVSLEARAPTEQQAREALGSMEVVHEDVLAASLLRLSTRVEFHEATIGQNLPVNIGSDSSIQRAASILAGMPGSPSYVLGQSSTNGPVEASGFSGTSGSLDSTNGSMTLDGRWDQASLDTTNGPVYVAGDFASVSGSSTNGPVYAQLATRRSTDASFSATNSSIEVVLGVSGAPGFDLNADTTNGRASIRVAGAEPVGNQEPNSAHHQTPDYATRAVQVQVSADATNGSVSIHD